LPFEYFRVRRVIDALRHNAENHNANGRWSLDAHIAKEDDGEVVTLTWVDQSEGFANWDSFKVKILTSMDEKGEPRGVPLAILFGLRFKAIRIEVLLKDRIWRVLYPEKSALDGTIPSSDSWTFGMRWIFQRSVEQQ
jgi:hypothetical protein